MQLACNQSGGARPRRDHRPGSLGLRWSRSHSPAIGPTISRRAEWWASCLWSVAILRIGLDRYRHDAEYGPRARNSVPAELQHHRGRQQRRRQTRKVLQPVDRRQPSMASDAVLRSGPHILTWRAGGVRKMLRHRHDCRGPEGNRGTDEQTHGLDFRARKLRPWWRHILHEHGASGSDAERSMQLHPKSRPSPSEPGTTECTRTLPIHDRVD